MHFLNSLNKLLRYNAEQASWLHRINPDSEQLALLAHNVLRGERDSLVPLADKFQEADHPIAPILQRIYHLGIQPTTQEAFYRKAARSRYKLNGIDSEGAWYPHTDLVTHVGEKGEPKASMFLSYLNHPEGHHWLIDVSNNYGRGEHKEVGPAFLVPTSPEEVEHVANQFEKMGEYNPQHKEFADHLRRTLQLKPGEVNRNPV